MRNAGMLQSVPFRTEQSVQTGSADIAVDALRLRPVATRGDLECVMLLRRQIALPGALAADPGFAALEKKETLSALLSPSRWAATLWERHASFRSAMA